MAKPKGSGAKHVLEYVVAKLLLGALRILPSNAALTVARASTRTLDRLSPKLRRTALTNLSFAYPELTVEQHKNIADGVFQSLARMLVAFARLPSLTKANVGKWIDVEGMEHVLAAKAHGKGILIATAHFGNWELSAVVMALMTEPMSIMVRPLDNPYLNRLVERRRTISGNNVIEKKDAARSVLKALRRNELVGILLDQNTSLGEAVFVDFFGRRAATSPVFVKFAYHSQAPILPGYAMWDEARKRYRLIFEPTIPMTGDVERDMQAVHSTLEQVIRRNPDQWLWIHRRWKTRPPGESSS